MLRLRLLVGLSAVGCAWTVVASAVTGPVPIEPAGGPTTCLTWLATPGCEQLRGVTGGAIGDQRTLTALAMSPDGRNLYVAVEGQPLRGRPTRSSSVLALRRRADTGALEQLAGRRGCLTLLPYAGCARARAIDNPVAVMVSPDGRFVYTAALSSRGAAIFARDRHSGALRQLPGRRGCLRHPPGTELCAYRDLGRGINDGFREWARLSPDGRFLYGFDRPIRRDARSGGLSLTDNRGCRPPCGAGRLAIAPRGRDVYMLDFDRYAVHGLRIAEPSGALRRMPRAPRCWPVRVGGCRKILGEVAGISIAPDGRHVYVTLGVRDAVVRFGRRASGLLTRGTEQAVCGGRSSRPPCAPVGGGALADLLFAPGGRRAYAIFDSSIVAQVRDPRTGALAAARFPGSCVTLGHEATGCQAAPAVGGSYRAAVVSPDGRFLYVLMSGALVTLRLAG